MEIITEKRFNYWLEVLPPLVMGRHQVICFLKEFDQNPVYTQLNDFDDLFIQGEGYDKHKILGSKAGKFYFIGDTLKEWETEYFRYDDSSINMNLQISNKLKEAV